MQPETTDPAFETAVEEYIEEVVAKEKETFRSDLQPFNAHAAKIRKELADSMREFQTMYRAGYAIIMDELAKQYPSKDPSDDPLERFRIKETSAILDDPIKFLEFLSEGKSIYQLFGFSVDTLEAFFQVGVKLLKENRFEEAQKVFYFLVTIAAKVSLYWLGLALCYAHCKEFEEAKSTCEKAIELDPHSADPYVLLVRIYLQMDRSNDAKKVIKQGLATCREHKDEPWAKGLSAILEDAQRSV